MKDVAIWCWGTVQGSAATAFGALVSLEIPLQGPDVSWWAIVIMLITIFGNAAALAFLIGKFKKYW